MLGFIKLIIAPRALPSILGVLLYVKRLFDVFVGILDVELKDASVSKIGNCLIFINAPLVNEITICNYFFFCRVNKHMIR